jgi:hypothetical protein
VVTATGEPAGRWAARLHQATTGKNGKLTTVIHISTTEGDKGGGSRRARAATRARRARGEELGGVDSAGNIDITMNGSLTGI